MGPVLSVTTEAMMAHTQRLLQIPGAGSACNACAPACAASPPGVLHRRRPFHRRPQVSMLVASLSVLTRTVCRGAAAVWRAAAGGAHHP